MKKLTLPTRLLTAAGLLLLASTASASFISTGAIESDGTNATLDHTYFSVNTAGTIEIALSSTDDPEMNLRFASADGTLGSLIENDDDGGPGLSSFISRFLNVGIYAIINGEFAVSNAEGGFSHFNPEGPSNPYTLSVSGDTSLLFVREGNLDGSFTQTNVAVPAPVGAALLWLGLLGLGVARRRRS